ncbi:MAG: hypothetical protein ACI38A_12170 [Candidatus Ornithomonoglobus sp.]
MATIATPGNIAKQQQGNGTTISGAGTVRYTEPAQPKQQTQIATPNVLQSAGGTTTPAQSAPMSGIRNRLTGIGFENDKIGYDSGSGFVTYNGQNIVKADGIDENGSSYAADDAITKGAYDYLMNNGYTATRQALTDRNINNSRIGYNESSGTVQIDGNDQIKPQFNIDGTTYTSADAINLATNRAYAATGDELKAASDYIAGLGIGANVKYDQETGVVDIGGTTIKPAYVSDGIAYIPKSQLDAAAEAYKQTQGMPTSKGVTDLYNERYDRPVNDALDKLTDREAFTWSPETDSSYQDHVKYQQQLAQDAYDRALSSAGVSAGTASSYQLAATYAAMNEYLAGLSEDEAEYRNDAYNRYLGETARLRDNLADTREVANDFYARTYAQDADTYNRSRQDRLDNWQRYKDELANENQRLQNEGYAYDNASRAAAAKYADSNASEALRAAQLANQAAAFDNGTRAASTLGRFFESDEAWLPELKNFREIDPITGEWTGGYTLGPWDSELVYEAAMKAVEQGQSLIGNATNAAIASAFSGVNLDGTQITGTAEQNSLNNDYAIWLRQAALGQALNQLQNGTTPAVQNN